MSILQKSNGNLRSQQIQSPPKLATMPKPGSMRGTKHPKLVHPNDPPPPVPPKIHNSQMNNLPVAVAVKVLPNKRRNGTKNKNPLND